MRTITWFQIKRYLNKDTMNCMKCEPTLLSLSKEIICNYWMVKQQLPKLD
jgi:hypothetical protein